MGLLLAKLLLLALAAALSPTMIVMMLTLLLSVTKPLQRAIAFVLGAAVICVVVGIAAAAGLDSISQVRLLHRSGVAESAIFAVAGATILAGTALEAILGPRRSPRMQPHKARRALGGAAPGPFVALALGAALMLINLKSLALLVVAVHYIVAAQVGTVASVLYVCGFIVAMLGALEAAILIYIADRERAATELTAARTWLEQHARMLALLIGALAGLYFLGRGIVGLVS